MRLPNSNVSTSSNATEGNNVPWVAQMPAVFNADKWRAFSWPPTTILSQ